jgi:hypothetical protein
MPEQIKTAAQDAALLCEAAGALILFPWPL